MEAISPVKIMGGEMNAQAEPRIHSERLSIVKSTDSAAALRKLKLENRNFPLTINYQEKTYILVLTKSGKLLLQKPFEDAAD